MTLPAQFRNRWRTSNVLVEDHGDYATVRPIPDDPITALRGLTKGRRGKSALDLKELEKLADQKRDERRYKVKYD